MCENCYVITESLLSEKTLDPVGIYQLVIYVYQEKVTNSTYWKRTVVRNISRNKSWRTYTSSWHSFLRYHHYLIRIRGIYYLMFVLWFSYTQINDYIRTLFTYYNLVLSSPRFFTTKDTYTTRHLDCFNEEAKRTDEGRVKRGEIGVWV